MKVVVDCNVFISAGMKINGTSHRVIREIIKNHACFISEEIIDEYFDLDKRKGLKDRKQIIKDMMTDFLEVATRVDPIPHNYRLRDPKDEKYIAAALVANADAIITGDADFTEPSYGGVSVIRPAVFFDLFVK